jgi:hypothetical protein
MSILEESLTRLESYRTTNRLIRRAWTGYLDDGRDTACLLAAISKEVSIARSVKACPAHLVDPWFAHLSPWFDDAGSDAEWPGMVARYGNVVRKLMSLPSELRMMIEYASRALIVREAMKYTKNDGALEVCETVAALCETVADGGTRDEKAFFKAQKDGLAASNNESGAAWSARTATRATIVSAEAAAAAADAVRGAASESAVRSVNAMTLEAGQVCAVPQAVSDLITSQIFDLIELAIPIHESATV